MIDVNVLKCIYEGVIVPTALYVAEVWGMRSYERRKVNLLQIKCLRNLVGVSRKYRVRNEQVYGWPGIEMEFAIRGVGLGRWREWMSSLWPDWR